MAAGSPTSDTSRPPAAGPATENAPSVTLPLRYVLAGLLSLGVAAGLLVAQPDLLATYHYNQSIVAVTHLVVLGFGLTLVMGAMFQLVPVALETRLWSERLASWQFPLHVVGVAGMVIFFWRWDMTQVGHFASVLALAAGLFLYNLARTLARAPHRDAVWLGLVSVLSWITLTLLAGLFLAASKCWTFSPFATIPAMHAHAHAGVLGIFVLLIITVSFRLVPMFVLGRVQNERRARFSIHLFNVGLAGLFVTLLLGSPWKLAFALVLLAALTVYGVELRAIFRARMRRKLDWGLRAFVLGLLLLLPLGALAVVLCWPGLPVTLLTTQLENVYGFLGVFGVVGLAIHGMLHKIAPFLVWFHAYSERIGHEPVPALSDLYSARLQAISTVLYLVALAITSVATALGHTAGVRAGCILLAASLATLAVNLGMILSHWFRARPPRPTTPTPEHRSTLKTAS